jgi:hypothetical protein
MALLWAMFYLACLGLGYPTLNRYDPAKTAGMVDAQEYRHAVLGDTPPDHHVRYRVLVPYLARPIYHLTAGRIGSWDPVWFSMLIVNSAFVAGAALMLARLAAAFSLSASSGLLAAFAYLLNFNVANDQLAGLVDSSEAFMVTLLLFVLWHKKWNLLPIVVAFGVLAKETFLPIAILLTLGWIWRADQKPWKHFALMLVSGSVVLLMIPSLLTGHFVSPRQTVIEYQGFRWTSLLTPLISWTVWLTFLWPLPFAVAGWRRLPRELVPATALALIGIYLMGSFADMGASISRPLFNVAGPWLCLAFAAGVEERFTPQRT